MTNTNFIVNKKFIALMACLTGLTAIGIDAVLPIFPEMIDYYQLPEAQHNRIQQVVFMYMLGFSMFQLIFGILADTIGRKPLLFVGIGIYSMAALSVIFMSSFDNVLLARFIQGAGLAAPRVLTVAIVRDVSSGREMSRIMSFITMIFLAVPAIAPMIGQLIVLVAPWKTVFVLLFLLGIALMIWVKYSMPETLKEENRRPLSLRKVRMAIGEVMRCRVTLLQLTMISVLFGGLMIYIGQAEQIMQKDIYQLGVFFPFAFSAVVMGMMGASVTNANIVMRIGLYKILSLALIILTLIDVIFFIAVLLGDGTISLWAFLLIMIVHFFSFGLMMPNLNTLALSTYHHIAGTASALIGMITSVVGLVIAQIFSYFYNSTLYSMAIGFVILLIILLCAYYQLIKLEKKL